MAFSEKQSGDPLAASEWNAVARAVSADAGQTAAGRGRIGGSFGMADRRLPGGRAGGVEVYRIVAFTAGVFGAANSGIDAKRPEDYANAAIPATPVAVWSYSAASGHEAEVGLVDLTLSSPFGVGSYIRVFECVYADGIARLCLFDAVEECESA